MKDQHNKLIAIAEDNDMLPRLTCREFSMTIATLQPIVEALNKILAGNGSMVDTIKWGFSYIKEMEIVEWENKEKMEIQAKVSSFCKAFKHDLFQVQDNLLCQLYGITDTLNVTLETSEKALKVAEDIKGKALDIISNVGKVTSTMDKITNTMQLYCDVLMTNQLPANKSTIDPKVLSDMEHKDRQLLVDIYNKEGVCTMDKSLMELMDLANMTLDKMSDGEKPEKVKVESVHKTKRHAILLTLNSKEAAS